MNERDFWRKKRVLITGGLGMIGSTIAAQLVSRGAETTLVDACIEPYGANFFNVEAIKNDVRVNYADIRDREAVKCLVRDQDVIFNLAGQVSHNDSLKDPLLDADINYIGHLNVLECVRLYNPAARVLHAGSRLQFGRIDRVPVAEDHALRPRTPYAMNKTAAENMYLFYHEVHGISTVMFRIANPYGPRSQMRHSKYSMINWFIRQAMENKPLTVFGDGSQVRDYIYVDDLASAFIEVASVESCSGEIFNVGSGVGSSFREMAESIVAGVGRSRIEYVPWPKDYINVETGDYVTDIAKISKYTTWKPRTILNNGIKATVAYYQNYWDRYV